LKSFERSSSRRSFPALFQSAIILPL